MPAEQTATSDTEGRVHFGPRRVGPPPTLSDQALAAFTRDLAVAVPAQGTPEAAKPRPRTTMTTDQQWAASVRDGVDEVQPALDRALAASQVTVTEDVIAGVPVFTVTPPAADPSDPRRLLDFHGGGYVYNPGRAGLVIAVWAAHATGLPVTTVDYRMPPEHPYPAALDDCTAVYGALAADNPDRLGLIGLSAGGALVASVLLRAREEGLAMSAGAVLLSPWSDLAARSDSLWTLEDLDPSVTSTDGDLDGCAVLYLGDTPREDPLASPVYADYSPDLPPALLVTGTRDLLLSDTVRLHQRMRAGGVHAQLMVYEGMWHGFLYDDMPEARVAWAEIADFLQRVTRRPSAN